MISTGVKVEWYKVAGVQDGQWFLTPLDTDSLDLLHSSGRYAWQVGNQFGSVLLEPNLGAAIVASHLVREEKSEDATEVEE